MGAKRPVQMDWGLGATQASLHAALWEMRQRPGEMPDQPAIQRTVSLLATCCWGVSTKSPAS